MSSVNKVNNEADSDIQKVRFLIDERNKRLAEIAAIDTKINELLAPPPANEQPE